jgi:hypothetical protein
MAQQKFNNMKEIKKYVDFIKAIVERPAMYQVNRVEDIWLISFGYQHALGELDIKEIGNFLSDFRDYVNKDFQSNQNHSWERLIKLYSGSDKHSIELFGQLFFNYIKSRGENFN